MNVKELKDDIMDIFGHYFMASGLINIYTVILYNIFGFFKLRSYEFLFGMIFWIDIILLVMFGVVILIYSMLYFLSEYEIHIEIKKKGVDE